MAFAAGTGALVFYDLLFRIAFGQLNVIPKEEQLHEDF
jgi:hypothetical protein